MQESAETSMHKYEFEIESAVEIPTIVKRVQEIDAKGILGYIYAYLHNTVIVQTLKKELASKVPNGVFKPVIPHKFPEYPKGTKNAS